MAFYVEGKGVQSVCGSWVRLRREGLLIMAGPSGEYPGDLCVKKDRRRFMQNIQPPSPICPMSRADPKCRYRIFTTYRNASSL